KGTKNQGLQGSATFTCLFLNRKELADARASFCFNGIVCVKLAAKPCLAALTPHCYEALLIALFTLLYQPHLTLNVAATRFRDKCIFLVSLSSLRSVCFFLR